MSNKLSKLTNLTEEQTKELSELLIDHVAGCDVFDQIITMIGEDGWSRLNAEYGFSRESYDQDEYEQEKIRRFEEHRKKQEENPLYQPKFSYLRECLDYIDWIEKSE